MFHCILSEMKRLIILSDLWGNRKSNWPKLYIELLENHFDIQYYDCCELGGIDLSVFTEANIHEQFLNGGIDRATKAILDLEKDFVDHVLGFSIGGFIAWKAIHRGLNVGCLTAISSTRLRMEDEKPACKINLFYAEKDQYKPSVEWFANQNLEMNVYDGEHHDFYCKNEIAREVSNFIITQ